MKAIAPEAVTDAVVDDYMRYRGETTALAVDIKARRAIARAWNASRNLSGWPQQTLTEPPLKANTEWPNWRDFPASLQEDIENYLKSLTKSRRGIDKKRLGACKLSTIRTRRMILSLSPKRRRDSASPSTVSPRCKSCLI